MNNHSKGKGLGISFIREVLLDLLVVGGGSEVSGVHKPVSEVGECSNGVDIGDFEVGVVRKITSVSKVRSIDVVPERLETVDALDVIGEGGALNEGVVNFTFDEGGLGLLKDEQLGEGSLEDCGVFGLKNLLGSCCDYTEN